METDPKTTTTEEELPRERLISGGPQALADADLLAILLGSGNKQDNVFSLAKKILAVIDEKNGSLSVRDLTEIRGVGQAKACLIAASLEFARRRIKPSGLKIRQPSDVMPLLQHLADRKQEHFICFTLNGAHEILEYRTITIGLLNAAHVHPREVFADAIVDRAAAIIVAHNHPSGELLPSTEDRLITKQLREAGKILGIKVLDHLIFSPRGYYSFQEHGE